MENPDLTGTVVDIPTAARLLRIGKATAYEAAKTGACDEAVRAAQREGWATTHQTSRATARLGQPCDRGRHRYPHIERPPRSRVRAVADLALLRGCGAGTRTPTT